MFRENHTKGIFESEREKEKKGISELRYRIRTLEKFEGAKFFEHESNISRSQLIRKKLFEIVTRNTLTRENNTRQKFDQKKSHNRTTKIEIRHRQRKKYN